MKLKAPDDAATTALSPMNWFSGICLAAFLTIIYPSTGVAKRGAGELNATEEWIVTQTSAGEIADLSKQFPEKEKDKRKLSAHFLEELLTGALPGIKLHRHGVRIIGATIEEPVGLENAQFPCEVWLEHCQFNASANFNGANFAGTISFENSTFKADANFNSMKAGRAAFSDAVFEGPLDVGFADIASNFEGNGAKFQNTEMTADFGSMKVRGYAFFNAAVFEGPANFGSADIASNLQAQGAKFQNKEKIANFSSLKVRGYAFFLSGAVFEGPADFGSANIATTFAAPGAKFQSKEKQANFGGMKVGGYAFLNDAVFKGPVNFVGADVAGNFAAGKAKFKNKEKDASFGAMKLGGHAFFNDAVFEGPVNFNYADFAWLDLSKTVCPKVAAKFHMQGMSYKYIRAAPNEPESHRALLKLADQSAYSADVYNHLEEFFLRQGYRDDADRAFIQGKRRERKENLRGLSWVGDCLLDWLVGYGRRPWQAGIPCAALVALGCVPFSPKKMEPQKPEDTPRVYSRFWYSLGLFLPFVDLQADKVWKPKADQTFLRNYMRVHIMLGWILVPLVLAALTGLIK